MNNRLTQQDYVMRRTGNYSDLIYGDGYHSTPISFHEFLTKPESLFIYDESFMQIPDYVQKSAEIDPIEETARQYVVNYIIEEFENLILGKQDYVTWAKRFKNKCDSLAPAFWSQVNMIDLMLAKDLEMDDNTIDRNNTGNTKRIGTGQTTTSGNSTTTGSVEQTSDQDITNRQTTDSSSRDAAVTVLPTNNQLNNEVQFDWTTSADNAHEVRSRSGDAEQHTHSHMTGTNNSTTDTTNTSTQERSDQGEQFTNKAKENMHMTNKQFYMERQWALQTDMMLQPLNWLRNNLRPMFFLLY